MGAGYILELNQFLLWWRAIGGIKAVHTEMWYRKFVIWLVRVCKCKWRRNWHISVVGLTVSENFNQEAWSIAAIKIQLASVLATLRLVWSVRAMLEMLFVLFSTFNTVWFVTKCSWSSLDLRCRRPYLRQHVEASNSFFITLLPIRNVLILNCEFWSDFVLKFCVASSLSLS